MWRNRFFGRSGLSELGEMMVFALLTCATLGYLWVRAVPAAVSLLYSRY